MENNNPKHRFKWDVNQFNAESPFSLLPAELLKLIVSTSHVFDLIMLRSSCKSFFSFVAKQHPFPKYFVHNHYDSTKYYIELGSISCLEYLKSLNVFFPSSLTELAVEKDDIDVLKFLRANNCVLKLKTAHVAAEHGKLEMLKYCLKNGVKERAPDQEEKRKGSKADFDILSLAAIENHLEIVKYLHKHGFKCHESLILHAVNNNRIECLQFALKNKWPIPGWSGSLEFKSIEALEIYSKYSSNWKEVACKNAVQIGDLEMLKWAHSHGALWNQQHDIPIAVYYDSLECLKYMLENGAKFEQSIKIVKSVQMLKFLVEQTDAELSPQVYVEATRRAERDILEYLLTTKTVKPHFLGLIAAGTGDFEFFKWCIEEQKFGLQPKDDHSPDLFSHAVYGKNVEVIKYVLEKNLHPKSKREYIESLLEGCPLNVWKLIYNHKPFEFTDEILLMALKSGDVEKLEWTIQKGAKYAQVGQTWHFTTEKLPAMAFLLKHRYKLANGCYFPSEICFKYAYEHGYLDGVEVTVTGFEMLRCMVQVGYPITIDQETYDQLKSGDPDCADYLKELGAVKHLKRKKKQ